MDREKLIKHFEHLMNAAKGNYQDFVDLTVDDGEEILILLKEQEAIDPKKEHSGSGITWWNVCGNCKTAINPNDKYCHECGRAVKWE